MFYDEMDEEEDSRFKLGTSMQKGEPKVHGNVLDELYNERNESTDNLILKLPQS